MWAEQDKDFLSEALVDIDGTQAETLGVCKEGMDISYKGIWGYAPLLISLANTREPLKPARFHLVLGESVGQCGESPGSVGMD